MIIPVKTEMGGYDIVLKRGALKEAKEYFDLNRSVLIVTDNGVPREYAETVAAQCREAIILVLPQGEENKNFDNYKKILEALVCADFTRSDCVVAVGGGVVGDMAGFAAACFMRGIDFYNIPTTVLSQVDSSIGGKTAIDFCGYKNIVGAFHQPKGVIVDADTLETLDKRMMNNGLAEALKMAATHDADLFALFESGEIYENIESIIERSLKIKKSVVESDERESGLRRVLNFGHTVGHAIESNTPSLYHGECVALGMLPMCSDVVKNRIKAILKSLDMPIEVDTDIQKIVDTMRHDKKVSGNSISVVTVDEIGKFAIQKLPFEEFACRIKAVY